MSGVVTNSPRTHNSKNSKSLINENHAGSILSSIQTLIQDELLCDVILIAGNDGKRVSAHRLVLAAASEYFKTMFTGAHREAFEKEITLHDVNGNVLEILVKFCYTGLLDDTDDLTENVLRTAHLWHLSSAVAICCDYLIPHLHTLNCLGFLFFAEQYNCQTLLKAATEYACYNFLEVCKNDEFVTLNAEELGKLLLNDDLNVPSEETVFNALKLWVEHDPVNRKKNLPNLLKSIRLLLLSPSFIFDHVEKLCDSDECAKPIKEALKYHMFPERQARVYNIRRKFKDVSGFTLLAFSWNREMIVSVHLFYTRTKKWNLLGYLSTERIFFEATVLNDKLIILGGGDNSGHLNTVECVNIDTLNSMPRNRMQSLRWGLTVVVLNDFLYAIGGKNGRDYLNSVERYNPFTQTWNYITPMYLERKDAGAVVLNGKIYVCGGRGNAIVHDSVECYDPVTNEWTLKASMSKSRSNAGVAVLNGYLYTVGGDEGDCTAERYDPSTNSWEFIASLNVPHSATVKCAALSNRLIAVRDNFAKEYDAQTNEWQAWSQFRQIDSLGSEGCIVLSVPINILPKRHQINN